MMYADVRSIVGNEIDRFFFLSVSDLRPT